MNLDDDTGSNVNNCQGIKRIISTCVDGWTFVSYKYSYQHSLVNNIINNMLKNLQLYITICIHIYVTSWYTTHTFFFENDGR